MKISLNVNTVQFILVSLVIIAHLEIFLLKLFVVFKRKDMTKSKNKNKQTKNLQKLCSENRCISFSLIQIPVHVDDQFSTLILVNRINT